MCSGLFRCEARPTTKKDPLKSIKHRPTQTRLSGGSRGQAEYDVVMLSGEESYKLAKKSLGQSFLYTPQ